MITRVELDRDAVRAWLDNDGDDGGAHWANGLAGSALSLNDVYDIVGDWGVHVEPEKSTPLIYAEAEPDTSPEDVVAVVEAAPGAWVSSAPFTLQEASASVEGLKGADAFVGLLEWVVARVNASIDALNAG